MIVLQGAAAVLGDVQPVRVEVQRGARRVHQLVDDVQPGVDKSGMSIIHVPEPDPTDYTLKVKNF